MLDRLQPSVLLLRVLLNTNTKMHNQVGCTLTWYVIFCSSVHEMNPGDGSCLPSFFVTVEYAKALPAEIHSALCWHNCMDSDRSRLSQLVCCKHSRQQGAEPNQQLSCRNHNHAALGKLTWRPNSACPSCQADPSCAEHHLSAAVLALCKTGRVAPYGRKLS